MTHAVYEFPINEKVRTYLRLEQLFKQLEQSQSHEQDWQYIGFFESFFTLLDLLERVDLRTDILKDIDAHEKNLVYWSQHPKIDNNALQQALKHILDLRERLKNAGKVGSELKEDRFLKSIRQRFAIPGGTCSFDLPNLHFWLRQSQKHKHQDIQKWLTSFELVKESIEITLSFLRERGRFAEQLAAKGVYQGNADDKNELIRIHCSTDQGFYPVFSGNKYRYVIRFMYFSPENGAVSPESDINFKLACC